MTAKNQDLDLMRLKHLVERIQEKTATFVDIDNFERTLKVVLDKIPVFRAIPESKDKKLAVVEKLVSELEKISCANVIPQNGSMNEITFLKLDERGTYSFRLANKFRWSNSGFTKDEKLFGDGVYFVVCPLALGYNENNIYNRVTKNLFWRENLTEDHIDKFIQAAEWMIKFGLDALERKNKKDWREKVSGIKENFVPEEEKKERIVEFVDRGDPPLDGKSPNELEEKYGIQVEILDKYDYGFFIRVFGEDNNVELFEKDFLHNSKVRSWRGSDYGKGVIKKFFHKSH